MLSQRGLRKVLPATSETAIPGMSTTAVRRLKCRNWMLTSYRESLSPEELYASFAPRATFAAFQLEKCPTTGRKHYQCYIEFSAQLTFATVKKLDPEGHWEARKGTQAEAIAYCSKEDTRFQGPWEFGVTKRAGTRSDLADLYKLALEGKSPVEASESMPACYMRYHKAYAHIQSMHRPSDIGQVQVNLLLGPTSTGKTHAVRKNCGPELWVSATEKSNWYDGYIGQPDVLFDEYKGHISLTLFLRLLHGYTERVPIKGGHTWWRPKRIFITSNYHPSEWYDYANRAESRVALYRRINYVYEFDGVNQPVAQEGLDFFSIRSMIQSRQYFDLDFNKEL